MTHVRSSWPTLSNHLLAICAPLAILLTQGMSSRWHALGNTVAVICVLAFFVRLSRSQARLQRMRGELTERELRYSSVVAAMREGVLLRNADGVIYACNAAAQQILGATEDDLNGRTSFDSRWDVVDEQGNPFPMDAQPSVITLRTGKPCHDVIMGIRDAAGELKWISINTQPLIRFGEDKPYAVVSSFSDISERKLMQDALQFNEERYRRLVDNIPDVIWTSDASGRITYISPNVENVYGYSPTEMYENGAELWMDRIHSDDRERVMGAFHKLFSENGPFDQETGSRKRIVNGYGSMTVPPAPTNGMASCSLMASFPISPLASGQSRNYLPPQFTLAAFLKPPSTRW